MEKQRAGREEAMSPVRLNIGCGPYKAPGWVNTDVMAHWEPDVLDINGDLSPFKDESADEIYTAHILEHIPWEDVPAFLDNVFRVLKPGGTLIVVGPDVELGAKMYKAGQLSWDELWPLMEWPNLPEWDAPRHFWNCSGSRVASLFDERWSVEPVDIASTRLDRYPVTSRIDWQFALLVTKK